MIISVTGSHRRSRSPELATLRLRLEFEAAEPAGPMARLREAVAELSAAARELEARPEAPIGKWSVGAPSTRTWTPYDDRGAAQPPRFAAWAQAEVEFADFEALGAAAADWGRREGWSLQGVSWSLRDETARQLRDEVTAEAVRDAAHRAEVIAGASGAGPVRVFEIRDPDVGPEPQLMAMGVSAKSFGREMAPDGLVIEPAPIWVEATVHARFEA